MTFDEIDNLLKEEVKDKIKGTCRRDYRKMEKENPGHFKGYGKKNGIMYLSDIDGSHYLDIRLLPNEVRIDFRKDDSHKINMSFGIESGEVLFSKENLDYFFYLIDEYYDVYKSLRKKISDFKHGIKSTEWTRNSKIENIISH